MKHNFFFPIIFLLCSFSLAAQSVYYNHGHDNFVRLEYNRPIFSEDFEFGFFSFDSYVNGEFTVGEKSKIAIEMPYSRFSLGTAGSNFSDSQLGNISIAFQIRKSVDPNYAQFKVRLPTAQSTNFSNSGLLSVDYTERFTSFISDIASLEYTYNFESFDQVGFYYRLQPGLKGIIGTSDNAIRDGFELLFDLSAVGGYRNEKIDANFGITSTSLVTEGDIDFDDRVLRQLVSTFTYKGGAWKPGIIVRIPLAGVTNDLYDLVLGIHVGYTFGAQPDQEAEKGSL